jgi:hypothetical protein
MDVGSLLTEYTNSSFESTGRYKYLIVGLQRLGIFIPLERNFPKRAESERVVSFERTEVRIRSIL